MTENRLRLERLTLHPDDTSESVYLSNYLSAVPEVKIAKDKTVLQRRRNERMRKERAQGRRELEIEVLLQQSDNCKGRNRPSATPNSRDIDKPVIIDKNSNSLASSRPLKYEILLPDEKK